MVSVEADLWTKDEADVAQELLRGLRVAAQEQKERLVGQGRHVDDDRYLWGQQEPDYVGELAREVARIAGDNVGRRRLCERVAERLLDRSRVRVATVEERSVAAKLLEGLDTGSLLQDESLSRCLVARAEALVEEGFVQSRWPQRRLKGQTPDKGSFKGRLLHMESQER